MSLQSMRVFSTEFKETAVRRLEAGEALAAVARELKIARKLLYEWRAAYRAQGVGGLNRERGRKPGQQRAPEGLAVKPPPEPSGDLGGNYGDMIPMNYGDMIPITRYCRRG